MHLCATVVVANVDVDNFQQVIYQSLFLFIHSAATWAVIRRISRHHIKLHSLHMFPHRNKCHQTSNSHINICGTIFNEQLHADEINMGNLSLFDEDYFSLHSFINTVNWRLVNGKSPRFCFPKCVYNHLHKSWFVTPFLPRDSLDHLRTPKNYYTLYLRILLEFVAFQNVSEDNGYTSRFLQNCVPVNIKRLIFLYTNQQFDERVVALHYWKQTANGVGKEPYNTRCVAIFHKNQTKKFISAAVRSFWLLL